MKRALAFFTLFAVFGLGGYYYATTPELPNYDKVKSSHQSSELVLLDREGRLLHQWRQDHNRRSFVWVSLKELSPTVVPAILKSEDRNFFRHSGIDFKALSASVYQRIFKNSSRGASTLSMQVAKLSAPTSRWQGLGGKIRQIFAALKLERSWTKEEILESYLNLATFRGENQGLSATSWALFGKSPSGLTNAEATLLAVLLRAPNASQKEWNQRACWQEPTLCSEFSAKISQALMSPSHFPQEGQKALHLAQRLSKLQGRGVLQTTVNLDLQNYIQQMVESQIHQLSDQNVHDAAVLVIENSTGQVWAYVGGSGSLSSASYVDGVLAKRQAGSTLKPFLYATAFEKNVLTPESWLEDSAVDIVFDRGVYKPQNHDHLFYGWVQAKTALGSSLNVPAVKVFKLLNDNSFWQKLQLLHFEALQDPDFYGPALALGVADISLQDLTQAYRTLARGGIWSPMTFTANSAQADERVFSEKASSEVTGILSAKENRVLGFGLDSALSQVSETAVKTGTSKDMRDNWCVGYNSRFTVGVWVGNFNGQPMWNVMGVDGAAPLWGQVMGWLQKHYPASALPGSLAHQTTPSSRPQVYPRVRIAYPQDGMILAIDPAIPLEHQKMPLLVEGDQEGRFSWRINGKTLVSAKEPYLWTPTRGRHTFELISKTSQAPSQKVQVLVK